jgi:hypothetical protein
MRLFLTGLTLQLFVGILMPLLITSFGTYSSSAYASDGSQEASASDESSAPMVFKKFPASSIDVQIDGRLDESIWSQIEGFDNMRVVHPDTLKKPGSSSLTRMFYTEKGLYFGIKCTQAPETLVARLTSRDTTINRDGVSFIIDPSGRGLYSYWFKVNLGGTLVDGTVLPEKRLNVQWDGPWYGAASEIPDGWSAEMYLPWSMMSMPSSEKTRTMAFYVSRKVAHLDEMWSYPALPETNGIFLSGFRHAVFEDINPKQQYAFYPYTSATYDRIKGDVDYRAGFDVDWRPSSNLQLTATITPDFGQVESDDIVVNLSAFETFFPERRLFFLEGYEIFVTSPRAIDGVVSTVSLVNTRRIGGAPRAPVLPSGGGIPDLARSRPTDLFGALKLTGQQGKIRYGVLAALEDDTHFDGTLEGNVPFSVEQDGRDFGIMRLLYEDTDTGGRQSIGWISTAVLHPEADAFVHGLDLHYLSEDKKLSWDAQLLGSETDAVTGAGGFFDVRYIPVQGTIHNLALEYFDDKLDIGDLGYLRQNDIMGFAYAYERYRSDLPGLRNRNTRISYTHGHNTDGDLVRSGFAARRNWSYLGGSGLSIELNYAPSRWDDRNSYGNGSFRINTRGLVNIDWDSDSSRKISYGLSASVMSEDLHGTNKNYNANLELRPSDRLSLLLNLGYSDRDGWLLHRSGKTFSTYDARNWFSSLAVDVFLTAKQQFRIYTQWAAYRAFERDYYEISPGSGKLIRYAKPPDAGNEDFTISELTFQARYRWQIAPLSDLYLVYTRGSNLASNPGQEFGSLFSDAWSDPIVDTIVFKLRYRFGN